MANRPNPFRLSFIDRFFLWWKQRRLWILARSESLAVWFLQIRIVSAVVHVFNNAGMYGIGIVNAWLALLNSIFTSGPATAIAKVSKAIRHRWLLIVDELRLKRSKSTWFHKLPFAKELATVIEFGFSWCHSRSRNAFLWGIPCLVLTLGIFSVIAQIPFYDAHEKALHYRNAAFTAMQEERHDDVQLFYRKIAMLGEESPQQLFARGISLARQAKHDEAYKLMRTLAPLDADGLGEAHLWIANAVLNQHVEIESLEQRNTLIERHLEQANSKLADHPTVRQMMAAYRWATNRKEDARKILDELAMRNLGPIESAKIAIMRQRWGDAGIAQEMALKADQAFEKSTSGKNVGDYCWWARAKGVAGDHVGAIAVLREGLEQTQEDQYAFEEFEATAAHFLRSRRTQDSKTGWLAFAKCLLDDERCGDRVQRAIALSLNDPLMAEDVRDLLQPYLDVGKLRPHAIEAMADAAMKRKKYNEAKELYSLVLDLEPTNALVANNLGWLYANTDRLDLALQYANTAIELISTDPDFRETRGQIHLKMQRWAEAAKDLEFALNGQLNNTGEIHRLLFICHTQLGNGQLAKIHQEAASARSSVRTTRKFVVPSL